MAVCDVTLNFTNILIAKNYLSYFELSNLLAKYFLPYLLVFGLLFNLMFLFVVVRWERMRTTPNLYLSLQAIADCLYLIVQTGPTIWRVLNLHKAGPHNRGPWYHLITFQDSIFDSRFGCFFHAFVTAVCYYMSIGFVIGVSYDRYLAIVYPLRYQRTRRQKHTIKILLGIFIAVLVLSICRGIFDSGYVVRCLLWPRSPPFDSYHTIQHDCVPLESTIIPTVKDLMANILFAVALLSTSFCYGMIVSTLGSRRNLTSNTSEVINIRNQVTRMVVITGIVFFICQLPLRVRSLLLIVERYTDFKMSHQLNILLGASGYGTHLNCAVNALLYFITNPFYRKALWDALSFTNKPTKTTSQLSLSNISPTGSGK